MDKKPDDAMRERIVGAAYHVFLDHGFSRTTTEMIAANARTSKRSIYAVFSNKDELFAAVVLAKRHLILDLPQDDDSPSSFLDRLAKAFRLDISDEEDREREALLNLVTREALLSPQLTDYLYTRGIIRTREDLIDWLLVERQRGRVDFDDVSLVASLLMNVVFGALLPRRKTGMGMNKVSRTHEILQSLDVVLKGLAARHREQEGCN